MTIRLEHSGKVYGLLAVSMPIQLTTDEEEQSLFMEAAGDLAFALYSLEQEEAQKRAEEELLESEVLNRSLVEHLPQRIFLKDRDLAYLSCNANYALDLGIEPNQIVGKDDFAFFPPELAEGYQADDRAVMATGKIKDIEERYKAAGEERWIHTIKVPYHDAPG